MKNSTTPLLEQLIWRTVLLVRGTTTPSGAKTTSFGSPSSREGNTSEITVGSAQLPPIQPWRYPLEPRTALSRGPHHVGRSARTTVATANVLPREHPSRSCMIAVDWDAIRSLPISRHHYWQPDPTRCVRQSSQGSACAPVMSFPSTPERIRHCPTKVTAPELARNPR